MNKQRRKELWEIYRFVSNVLDSINPESDKSVILNLLMKIVSDLESLKLEEEYYMYNIPDNLQGSSRYDIAEEACDNMETAISYLKDTIEDAECTIMEIKHTLELSMKYIDLASA